MTRARVDQLTTESSSETGTRRLRVLPSKEALSDETVVRQCLAGEREAFEILFERYRQPVFALALRYSGSPDEASDLLQDVFLKVKQEKKRLELF